MKRLSITRAPKAPCVVSVRKDNSNNDSPPVTVRTTVEMSLRASSSSSSSSSLCALDATRSRRINHPHHALQIETTVPMEKTSESASSTSEPTSSCCVSLRVLRGVLCCSSSCAGSALDLEMLRLLLAAFLLSDHVVVCLPVLHCLTSVFPSFSFQFLD